MICCYLISCLSPFTTQEDYLEFLAYEVPKIRFQDAWQRGVVPLSRAAIEHALELNGVAVEANRLAFLLGALGCARCAGARSGARGCSRREGG